MTESGSHNGYVTVSNLCFGVALASKGCAGGVAVSKHCIDRVRASH